MLNVNTNVQAMTAGRHLNSTNDKLGGSLDRISSGLRITKAADDAAGLGVATNLESAEISTRMAIRNSNDGISIIQTAEGAANEVTDILQRMRELAVQSSSETLHDDERAYIEDEFVELSEEIARIASVTEFNGTQLSDGVITTISVQVGIMNAASSRITIDLGDLTTSTLGVSALGVGTTGIIGMSSSTGARSAIDAIDTALDTVNQYRSTLGSVQNRLDSAINNAQVYTENVASARSRIQDADFAEETAHMTKFQIMQQAGVAALAQAKNMNQSVVSLLS
jgi:flagellin